MRTCCPALTGLSGWQTEVEGCKKEGSSMFAYDKNLYICNHFAYVECELVYSLFLRARNRLQGRQPLTEEMVEKILEIEQEAFPERFLMEESFQNLQELAEYAHCSSLSQLEIHLTDNWYLIIADHHNCVDIVELADRRRKCPEILKILFYIMDRCGSRTIIAKCRETTSCRLLRLLADQGRIEILEDKVTYSLGEEFHFLKFRISRDYLKRQKENRRKRGRANEKSTGHHPDHGPGRRRRPGRHLGVPLYES